MGFRHSMHFSVVDNPLTQSGMRCYHMCGMSPCAISSIFTTLTMAGGLGLLVLGLSIVINLLIAKEHGEGLEARPAG